MNLNMRNGSCESIHVDSLLRNQLSVAQEEAIIAHLNSCESCRLAIQNQAAEPEAWQEAEELLKPAFFQMVESNDGSHLAQDGRVNYPHQIQLVLDSLGPTDDPDMLGRLGGYEVSGVVGSGGMGVVLKAIDKSLDRVVAIKVLAPHLAANGAARKRFAREAKAAAAVLHPNVIAIHSVSNDESLPYLVMPYLRGSSLQKRLDPQGPLSTNEILRIGSQVAAGLAAAHAQGLVHRDIKPANILLEDGTERVTLTDFGLARAVDDASITHSGVIAGTPQFMSPEQARGEPVEQRSDLFSLGSVLYSISAGRPPFRAESSYGVMRRICDDEPTNIREVNPDIPEWLCFVIAKLMSKRVEDRFGTAAEVAELLEQCLAHVQQPSTTSLPACLTQRRSFVHLDRKGVIVMLVTLGFSFFGMLLWQTSEPPDIAGQWVGGEWGDVVIKAKDSNRYTGTITHARHALGENHEGANGTLEIMWSTLQGRFNGHWKQDGDLSGKVSLRLVDNEIHGAWTTKKKSDNTDTTRLSELIWKRKEAEQADLAKSIVDRTNARAVAEAFVDLALQGDFETAATYAKGTAAEPKRIEGISLNVNQKRLPIKLVYVDESATPSKALAISEKARMNGIEAPLNKLGDAYAKETKDILTKFNEAYEKNRKQAKEELDKLRKNPNLIWRNGKPHDPVVDNIARCNEAISEIDAKTKNIEAVLQQIDQGHKANRPLEELLRIALNAMNDFGTRQSSEASDYKRDTDLARNIAANIERFESERVIPFRAELDRLRERSLGESHPSVITAKSRLEKYEEELARRKAGLKSIEEASSAMRLTMESRLKIAYGAQQETRSKLLFEKSQLTAEANALKNKMMENQLLISSYLISLADLEATKEVGEQIKENLRKLGLESELAKPENKRQDGPREGSIVLTLSMNLENWFVTDVSFSTMR